MAGSRANHTYTGDDTNTITSNGNENGKEFLEIIPKLVKAADLR
jgi:hypothetical protein